MCKKKRRKAKLLGFVIITLTIYLGQKHYFLFYFRLFFHFISLLIKYLF